MPPSSPPAATANHRPKLPSVSVIVPCSSPGRLHMVLRDLPPTCEVVIVDTGSASKLATTVRALRPDARVIRPGRTGVGNALASGVAASSGDVVVTLTGDGSTDPGEIPRYVAALVGGADVALGSRFRDGGNDLTGDRLRRWVDRFLIWFVNVLFGMRRTDPGFGYAAFWRDAFDRLELPDKSAAHAVAAWGDGPEIGPLFALRPRALGLRVVEVGSVAYPRMRSAARAERAGVRHWTRGILREYHHRAGRHATPASSRARAEVTPTVPAARRSRARTRVERPAWTEHNRQDGAGSHRLFLVGTSQTAAGRRAHRRTGLGVERDEHQARQQPAVPTPAGHHLALPRPARRQLAHHRGHLVRPGDPLGGPNPAAGRQGRWCRQGR